MKLRLALAALVLAASGCGSSSGGGSPTSSAPRIPPPVDGCPASSTPWRALGGLSVDAAAVGTGPAVVFANDSGNDVCGWLPLATKLIASKHRVAVFSYSNPSVQSDPQNLKDLLAVASAAAQGKKFLLVGASLGGRLVIEAAAQKPAGLVGIVSLSGEQKLGGANDILAAAKKVTLPVLYAGSLEDSYTEGATQQNVLHKAFRGNPNLLIQRPGQAHGVALLNGSDGAVVVPRITAFVTQTLG